MTSPAKPSGTPWLVVAGLMVVAFVGGGLLVYAALGARLFAPAAGTSTATPGAANTAVAIVPNRTALIIPTVTPPPASPVPPTAPPAPTATTAAAGTATAAPTAAPTPAATAAEGPTLTIVQSANVRGGPGFNYPVVGGIEAGKAVPLLGRDSSAAWYVIRYGAQGQGWVSKIVASYSGDVNSLPVVAAPPPPPPTATQPPAPTGVPTSPPPQSAHGLVGNLQLCQGRTTYAAGERICVIEKIYNSSDQSVSYGILGVNAVNTTGGSNWFQSSWTGYAHENNVLVIDPHCTGPVGKCDGQWQDGFKLSAGTYQFTLSICYSAYTSCQGGGQWETLTAPFTVVVQ